MLALGDFIIVGVFVWVLCGVCASVVGPTRYSMRLFFLTLLFMGPLGIAAALIMRTIEDYSQPPAAGNTSTLTTPVKPSAASSADEIIEKYNKQVPKQPKFP